ncbi:hypothetical protein ACQX0O_07085 [Corynebacterium diphtheriae]
MRRSPCLWVPLSADPKRNSIMPEAAMSPLDIMSVLLKMNWYCSPELIKYSKKFRINPHGKVAKTFSSNNNVESAWFT